MEFAGIILLVFIGLSVLWSENTRSGDSFTRWVARRFIGVNFDDMED